MLSSNYNKLLQHRLLSKEETHELIVQYKETSDPTIKSSIVDTLVKANFKYIYKLAYNFYRKYPDLPLDDYIQTACLSMTKTLDKFQPEKGWALLTYFTWWCRSALQRFWQSNHRTIYIPTHIQEEYRRIKKVIKQYESKHGCTPSLSYISTELEISIEKVRLILRSMRSTSSLDVNISNSPGEQTLLLELLDNSHTLGGTDEKVTNPFSNLEYTALTETIEELLENLSLRDRLIIELRYGLKDGIPRSLNYVANSMNPPVSREYIRQVVNRSLRLLRGSLGAQDLKELYIN